MARRDPSLINAGYNTDEEIFVVLMEKYGSPGPKAQYSRDHAWAAWLFEREMDNCVLSVLLYPDDREGVLHVKQGERWVEWHCVLPGDRDVSAPTFPLVVARGFLCKP